MKIISNATDPESCLITPLAPLPDDLIKFHPANLFFNFCITGSSADEVVLTLASRTPLSNDWGGARSTLGCVVDCAAHLVGWRALGICDPQEYELNFLGGFTVEALQVVARLENVDPKNASFHCLIQTSDSATQRRIAEAHGTLSIRL